jgi:hypothetical protein
MNAEQNSPDLQAGDIQYFPDHRCPACKAPAQMGTVYKRLIIDSTVGVVAPLSAVSR